MDRILAIFSELCTSIFSNNCNSVRVVFVHVWVLSVLFRNLPPFLRCVFNCPVLVQRICSCATARLTGTAALGAPPPLPTLYDASPAEKELGIVPLFELLVGHDTKRIHYSKTGVSPGIKPRLKNVFYVWVALNTGARALYSCTLYFP